MEQEFRYLSFRLIAHFARLVYDHNIGDNEIDGQLVDKFFDCLTADDGELYRKAALDEVEFYESSITKT